MHRAITYDIILVYKDDPGGFKILYVLTLDSYEVNSA